MKLRAIQDGTIPVQLQVGSAEEDFARACGLIESGDWDQAYELLSELRQMQLDSGLADAVDVAWEILDPSNSSSQTAERIFKLFPGRVIRIFDQASGWSETGLRELRDSQEDGLAYGR